MPLTREALQKAVAPKAENGCAIKRIRDTLPPDEQEILDEALALPFRVLAAEGVREFLRDEADVPEDQLPSIDQIHNHRARRGGCKCP